MVRPAAMEGESAVELPPSLWPIVHRAATGEPWPPSGDGAADLFLAQAAREGLLPLLFAASGLPPVVQAALARQPAAQRLAEARATLFDAALRALGGMLADEPFVLLKGADYMRRLYPRPALRPMQDLDLLVPAARLDAVCARLSAGGLSRRPPRGAAQADASYYERAFLLGDVIVELHQSFVQTSRHRVDYAALWSRRLAVPEVGPAAARLDEADAIAYHALALAKDEFSVALVRYVDWWLMVRGRPERLEAAAQRAREWHARRALFGTLRQAAALFPDLDSAPARDLGRALVGPLGRRWLVRAVLPSLAEQGRAGAVSRARQLWRKLWLLDTARHRLSFAWRHALATLRGRRAPRP